MYIINTMASSYYSSNVCLLYNLFSSFFQINYEIFKEAASTLFGSFLRTLCHCLDVDVTLDLSKKLGKVPCISICLSVCPSIYPTFLGKGEEVFWREEGRKGKTWRYCPHSLVYHIKMFTNDLRSKHCLLWHSKLHQTDWQNSHFHGLLQIYCINS